jgi:hypothetical protein
MSETQVTNFVAALEAKRADFLASVGNISESKKPLSANPNPLNASTSDVLAQLKAFVTGLAHQDVADAIRGKLTDATNTAQSSDDFEQFKQALVGVRDDARTHIIPAAVNQAFDKAQQMGSNQDQQTQEAICQFFGNKVEPMFRAVSNKTNGFILAAADNVESFLTSALEKIHDFFRDLSTFIDNALSE